MTGPEEIYAVVGRRIRARRRTLGLTQAVLGCRCGISFQQVHKHETGEIALTVPRLVAFAEALDLPVGQLLEGCATGARDHRSFDPDAPAPMASGLQ